MWRVRCTQTTEVQQFTKGTITVELCGNALLPEAARETKQLEGHPIFAATIAIELCEIIQLFEAAHEMEMCVWWPTSETSCRSPPPPTDAHGAPMSFTTSWGGAVRAGSCIGRCVGHCAGPGDAMTAKEVTGFQAEIGGVAAVVARACTSVPHLRSPSPSVSVAKAEISEAHASG